MLHTHTHTAQHTVTWNGRQWSNGGCIDCGMYQGTRPSSFEPCAVYPPRRLQRIRYHNSNTPRCIVAWTKANIPEESTSFAMPYLCVTTTGLPGPSSIAAAMDKAKDAAHVSHPTSTCITQLPHEHTYIGIPFQWLQHQPERHSSATLSEVQARKHVSELPPCVEACSTHFQLYF